MGKCNSKNIKSSDEYKLLKILSYNVRLIYDSPIRAKNISYFLSTRYKINYDIICLQCIYNENSKQEIIDILKNTYPYIEPTNEKIGFLIFSKYKILNYEFIKYDINNKIECNGYLYVNIIINDTIITIYNIIFQPDYKSLILNENIRFKQIEEIKNNILKNNDNNIIFIIGSLNIKGKNINKYSDEYNNFFNNNFIDLNNIKKNEQLYSDNRNDYILLYNNTNEQKNIKILKLLNIILLKMSFIDVDYSDHYPLELFVILKIK